MTRFNACRTVHLCLNQVLACRIVRECLWCVFLFYLSLVFAVKSIRPTYAQGEFDLLMKLLE